MLRPIDTWYLEKEEPLRSSLQFLRHYIKHLDPAITEVWQYNMPFFRFHQHRFAYLWIHRKKQLPYIGIVDGNRLSHPDLVQEKRSRMKIFLFDPALDLPVEKIEEILHSAMALYK